ncbi:MAG: helix-turn-helix domain-containing protein [Acidimicrobiales bacterium]
MSSVEKLAYSVNETAELLSVGRDSIYELLHTKRLRSLKVGSRRLITRADIESFLLAEASDEVA